MKTNEIRALIEEQQKAAALYNKGVEEWQSNTMYSKEHKEKQLAELGNKYAADKKARAEKAEALLIGYKKQIKAPLDMADPALGNFIAITQAMGENTPHAAIDSIIEHFRGNNTALKAVSAIAQANNVSYGKTVERFIVDEDAIDDAILDIRKDFDHNNGVSPIIATLAHIDEVEAQSLQPENIVPSNIPAMF